MSQRVIFQKQASRQNLAAEQPSNCELVWRQRQLLVYANSSTNSRVLPLIYNQEFLADCLARSPVRLVRLDLELDEATIYLWAEACDQVGKAVFLRIPNTNQDIRPGMVLWQGIVRTGDWILALLLTVLLSPLMVSLALLLRQTSSPSILVRQWRVGQRGRLFRMLQFRSLESGSGGRTSQMSRWLHQSGIERLPQLLNVLRGDMRLLGPDPQTLGQAVRLPVEQRHVLNRLPGMI